MPDDFSDYYASLLQAQYDCVDRIVLNAWFWPGHNPGGFRSWWRDLHGSDDDLDDAHLRRMAGRFSRRLRAYAEANGIPLRFCKPGERQHRIAAEYVPEDPDFVGLFAILVFRCPAPVWKVKRSRSGVLQRLERKTPFVNHYAFHIQDPEWGHVVIQMSSHPPFRARISLNGHEWVARRARALGIGFTQEGNCFTELPSAADLAAVAETLSSQSSIGRTVGVCERWIYSACLCFALDRAEQERTRFRYRYSVYQLEYSRNLLFRRAAQLDQVYQGTIDRTRSRLDLRTVRTVFGMRTRPATRTCNPPEPRYHVAVERPVWDLTVFKVHLGPLTVKAYDKGERVLRIEATAHRAEALRCGRLVDRLADRVVKLRAVVDRFLNVWHSVELGGIDAGDFDRLREPSTVGSTRVGGVDPARVRMRAVLAAITALAPHAEGFRAREVAAKVREFSGWSEEAYGTRRASYDLKKLRGKGLVERIGATPRYHVEPRALRTLTALWLLYEQVSRPLLAMASHGHALPAPKHPDPLRRHYLAVQRELRRLFTAIGIAA